MAGRVILVGAGPGDAGLITVKGLEAIRLCDVIVYDHLACESLLNETRPDCQWIYAGKVAGNHHMRQEETSRMLVNLAREGKNVVRLKGGDPFIFGRGGEEALMLKEAGIDFEVIPGISSCYAAAAYAGIPVTHRKLASSFHVITGHEDPTKNSSSLDYSILAREEGTLVFLMGLSRTGSICRSLISEGKDPGTPAAVISKGTTVYQKTVTGTLENIELRILEEKIEPPAVLVIGPVTQLQSQISWEQKKPLSGLRILVTACGNTARKLAEKIRNMGGEPVQISLIDLVPEDYIGAGSILSHAPENAWIVFTSRNGVEQFFEQLQKDKMDLRRLGNRRFAVIGQGTAAELERHGYYPDLLPQKACSQSLADALADRIHEDHEENSTQVLFFRAREASPVPVQRLDDEKIAYQDIALYRTEVQYHKAELLNEVLDHLDLITFCSASAVAAFCRMTDRKDFTAGTAFIGPVSAQEAVKQKLKTDMVASRYDLDGLVQVMLDNIGGK